jgi:tetratricopeptide (TPR) repeat protein
MHGIFISHTHADRLIADTLTALLENLFENAVLVNYSSRMELDGGIQPGEDWFRWIVEQVKKADVALILLTPASIQKPWVVWEGGAVAGASFAMQVENARVLPVTFGVKAAEIPTPFARTQLIDGTSELEIVKLLDSLLERFDKLNRRQTALYGARRLDAVKKYLARIHDLLLTLPLTITEAAVQEWLARLADLDREHRYSETQVMENWLDIAFGRDEEDKQRPYDVRIHRRLGELYAASKQPSHAARQFELARQLAPRDIFVLRLLGKAYLDLRDEARARQILKEIEGLDPDAFANNSENAALKARFLETTGDRLGARDVLQKALQSIPTSYYLGDLLGQSLLGLGEIARAKEIYQQVSRVLGDLREHNVWTCATALSAALVCEDKAAVADSLRQLRAAQPSRGQLESIERGVSRLVSVTGGDNSILTELHRIEARQ